MDQRLRRRLQNLRRHGRWIIGGTLLCMLAAFIISHARPKIYAATTYLLVGESKISATSPNPFEYSLLPTYVPLVDSDALIAQALHQFHLGEAPYHLTLHRFRAKGYLDVQVLKSTRLVEIDVQFPDAQLAANLANYIARSAVELNEQANMLETTTAQKFLKDRLDQAAARLAEVEASRLALQKRAQIENKETQLEILLDEKTQVSKQIESLQLALPQDDSTVKSLEQSLSKEPQTLQLKKSVTSDRFLEREAERLGANNTDGLSETEEILNATHGELRRKLADSAAQVAGEREAIGAATGRLPQVNRQINDLLAEVTELRSEIARSNQDFKLAGDAYESASRDYRNASVTVTSRSQDLRQVAPALIPEQPVGLGALLNAILVGMLGLVLLSGAALGLESLLEMQSESFHIAAEEESESVAAHKVLT
jgi:uncharacterized protein involved in exopolysaccharide biosynthesis